MDGIEPVALLYRCSAALRTFRRSAISAVEYRPSGFAGLFACYYFPWLTSFPLEDLTPHYLRSRVSCHTCILLRPLNKSPPPSLYFSVIPHNHVRILRLPPTATSRGHPHTPRPQCMGSKVISYPRCIRRIAITTTLKSFLRHFRPFITTGKLRNRKS